MTFREKIYTLREEAIKGVARYFISFEDGQAVFQETEVSHDVYLEFQRFVRNNRNLQSFDERHREYAELSDAKLNRRARHTPKSVEDIIIERERAETYRRAVVKLPEVQRRRFILYYEHGLKLREIGKMEGCGVNAVQRSIVRAKEKIIQKLKV